ncbi:MAG: oligoendopeptidase F [Oscillospiraceae bacterium]|nr:oligoendopeptidase F [Oscillospiraceae bacterium]
MDVTKIPERSEIPEEFTWDLRALFPDDKAWAQELRALKDCPGELAAYAGTLGERPGRLLDWFKLCDALGVRLEKLTGFAGCKSDQDTADSFYRDMRSKATACVVAAAGASAFATPEILAIDDDTLARFFAECPALETWRRPIERIRRKRAHILSAPEEKLLAAMGELAEGPESIGSALRNADLRFDDAVDGEGRPHTLTAGTYGMLMESQDRALRRSTFDNIYSGYGALKNTVAATLDAQFKTLRFYAGARRYSSTIEAALDENEVPVAVYDNLIEAVHQNLDKMYRYVALRKRLLGVEELHMYDVLTPVVPDAAAKIPYDEAKKTVLEALSVLGEDYVALLRRGFDERWIDVYENRGKRSGAYSSGSARPHPYVLLNHKDTLDSLFTIAHEMGHALHSHYSCANQPVCTSDYVIFVAEVASTCNEILLMRHLLNKTEDKKQRAYLLNHFLDQFRATVYRQTMFAEFEREMGRMAEAGEALTADALCEKYYALNKRYFGPDMVSDEKISLEWARIPHFFYNYYVYQYATGFSAAAAIAERILTLGAPAVEDYKRFLSGGCSMDPISLLKLAGVDMSTPEPVNAALKLFGELVEELENLSIS